MIGQQDRSWTSAKDRRRVATVVILGRHGLDRSLHNLCSGELDLAGRGFEAHTPAACRVSFSGPDRGDELHGRLHFCKLCSFNLATVSIGGDLAEVAP